MSQLFNLPSKPADALLAQIQAFREDTRINKLDLGVGVYRNISGQAPVMAAVKEAEQRLVKMQASKEYLAPEGDSRFIDLLTPIIFNQLPNDKIIGVQTTGGTGALRMAADLISEAGIKTIWLGCPAWSNHAPILQAAGLDVRTYPLFSDQSDQIDLDAALTTLAEAKTGDAILLQATCHNPTGIDLDQNDWKQMAEFIADRQLQPLLDLAYQGLGRGLTEDAQGVQTIVAAVPCCLIAYSCDKNFGLYRDRTGALYATAQNKTQSETLKSNMLELARANWSMPPDHGAAVVRIILDDPALKAMWLNELSEMQQRIQNIREHELWRSALPETSLASIIRNGKGMFSILPITPTQIDELRVKHGIYLISSGRINLAGLSNASLAHFIDALNSLES